MSRRREDAVTVETRVQTPRTLPRRFYEGALTAAEQKDLPLAIEIVGVDEEIALLRLQLRSALENRPDDIELMFRGIDLLAKMVSTKYRLSRNAGNDLSAALANVVRSAGAIWAEGARTR